MNTTDQTAVRTSLTHPLRIAELTVGQHGGAVGVTFAPGKYQPVSMTGSWARDLDADLAKVKAWGATTLVSLIEPWEFKELHIENLPQHATAHGLTWLGLPIVDGAAPDQRWLHTWESVGVQLTQRLIAGERVVVHCKGGLGRAGTVASMLLLQTRQFTDPAQVMAAVRHVRPGAIETAEQEAFLQHWALALERSSSAS